VGVDLSSLTAVLSKAGLPIAFAIAFAYVMLKPRRRGRTRWRTALRVMLSRHIWLHPSTLLDLQFYLIAVLGIAGLFVYTLWTGSVVSTGVYQGLTRWCGPHAAPTYLPWYAKVLIVFALYMAFEFAYWLDHFLSHKISFLWEFHKVHHSAEVLTPFANWRVHPVDTMVYTNILVVVMGSASGLIEYSTGNEFSSTSSAISGFIFVVYMAAWGHLQHSQFWLSCTGLAGRIVLSPAHHQIHHSNNPIHFDKNFGAGLALWDWLFGTLHIPQRHNEHIRFGTEDDAHLKRYVPSLLYPIFYAAKRLFAWVPQSYWPLGPSHEPGAEHLASLAPVCAATANHGSDEPMVADITDMG
jgi:sterol desaturase/sphingolipid hydroxylase (fatty acid hydroxylase superfamily)